MWKYLCKNVLDFTWCGMGQGQGAGVLSQRKTSKKIFLRKSNMSEILKVKYKFSSEEEDKGKVLQVKLV